MKDFLLLLALVTLLVIGVVGLASPARPGEFANQTTPATVREFLPLVTDTSDWGEFKIEYQE